MTCTGGARHPGVPVGKGSCEMRARARGGDRLPPAEGLCCLFNWQLTRDAGVNRHGDPRGESRPSHRTSQEQRGGLAPSASLSGKLTAVEAPKLEIRHVSQRQEQEGLGKKQTVGGWFLDQSDRAHGWASGQGVRVS